MPLIINIETSTKTCSAALAEDGIVISQQENNEGYRHAELLTTLIKNAVENAGKTFQMLDAVSVGKGPGSYTGLRTGVSTAKGLCYGLGIPLIAVDTLKAMTNQLIESNPELLQPAILLCPMIDARRMEVYCEIFDDKLNVIRKTSAEIIDENSFSDLLSSHKIVFFGDGADKCKIMLGTNENAVFIGDFYNSATGMAKLSEEQFQKNQFEDLAYFEPNYLKDYVAGKGKQML